MNIPTLKELFDGIISDLETELGVTIPVFGRVFLRAVAAVWAGKLKLFYLAAAFVQKNVFPDLADPERIGGTLERFGRIKLGRSPFIATQGIYSIDITGLNGATITAGTRFKSDDNSTSPGNLFVVDSNFTFPSDSTQTISVRALVGGIVSRLQVGDTMTAVSPLLNINDQATVSAETTEPLESENIEDYRQTLLNSFRLEPQGGAGTDYRIWSSDAQGVQRVYPYARSGQTGEVDVFVEATLADSTDGKGTPTAAILTDVETVIDFDPDTTLPLNERGRRPLGATRIVSAVTVKDVAITINDAVNITTEDQALISQALNNTISAIRPFVDSVDLLTERNDVLSINTIIFTIQNTIAAGKSFGVVELVVDSVPVVSNIQFTQGDIPVLDTITYA